MMPTATFYHRTARYRQGIHAGSHFVAIWSAYYKVHSDEIERVQRKCLRMLCHRHQMGRSCLDYKARLFKFNIQMLETRRKYFDFIYFYKLIHSVTDTPDLLYEITINTKHNPRRPNKTNLFALLTYKNNTSFHNPLVRMARQYNEMAIHNPNLDIFTPKLFQYTKILKNILYPTPTELGR